MFPAFGQRLMILGAAVVGGLVWLLAAEPLSAADGSTGISLFDARVGVLAGLVVLLGAGALALALALVVSATGHPLAGVFTGSVGLMFVAGGGGSMAGFLWRHPLPTAYGWLLGEAVLWAVLVVAMLALIRRLRAWLRARLERWATDEHWGDAIELGPPDARAMLAGLVAAVSGAVVCVLLLRSETTAQAIGTLLVAFTVGGFLAQLLVPQGNPVGILLSPLAVAAAAYGHVVLFSGYQTHDAVLAAWYQSALAGPALALPIFYASAGVAGCAMGIGLGQAIHEAREHAMVAQG